MPIFSLPSPYGIGCFSAEAYEFVDQLVKAGQRYWQILPLTPTGYGNSPYQSFSSFAGNPFFIDLVTLTQEGLLTEEECEALDWGKSPDLVDYEKILAGKEQLLHTAFERFEPEHNEAFWNFLRENGFWLEDYALYMAIKHRQKERQWSEWDEPLRTRQPNALQQARLESEAEMRYHRFVQYQFYKQWFALKQYANDRGISIIGDIPIYVASDSSDTWANPLLFQFDENSVPIAVAGCPPDGYSPTGQLWGNPLYSWEYHRTTEYSWWLQRISYSMRIYDLVRIDHFRGFDEYYSIPYGHVTAEHGHWEKGPGFELFRTLKEHLGDLHIIVEDLGFLTESVIQLVQETGYPGMKVLQFAFYDTTKNMYLPHMFQQNCVVYTGTHDNTTTLDWYESLEGYSRWFVDSYVQGAKKSSEEVVWEMIRAAVGSVADLAVIPIQDYLTLGVEARINTPSTLFNNWEWRLQKGQITDDLLEKIQQLANLYGRV